MSFFFPVDNHTVDGATLQPADADVTDKTDFAPRLHQKSSNSVRGGETGIQVLAVHRKADSIGDAGIARGSSRAAANFQRPYDKTNNVVARRLRSVNAFRITAVEYGDPVRRKKAARDSNTAGRHFCFHGQQPVRSHGVEGDARRVSWRDVVVGNNVVSLAGSRRERTRDTDRSQ